MVDASLRLDSVCLCSSRPGALVVGVILPGAPHADAPAVCGSLLAPPTHVEFPVGGLLMPGTPPLPQAFASVLDAVLLVPTAHADGCGVGGALPPPPQADVPVAGGILLAPPQALPAGPDVTLDRAVLEESPQALFDWPGSDGEPNLPQAAYPRSSTRITLGRTR